ncbi:MAG: hypothetical protein Q9211_005706 [Gyalolechia sp. 1 TL-2023]
MSTSVVKSGIIPATLAFLTIYNPSLSQSDDTIEEQIVYYYSKSKPLNTYPKAGDDEDGSDRELKNEKLRQVGLAQGMVEFANTPEPKVNAVASQQKVESELDYSAREVSPPALLLEQAVQAHQIFLLHHAQTLTDLLLRVGRPKFCAILGRFWDHFVWNWDVLLHGNPAIDMFNGLKLAAGGELGIGVGEEEWGSGEREVLEGFVGRTDGLVDLIVSRFGEAAPIAGSNRGSANAEEGASPESAGVWHLGQDPQPSDGVIFSGVGAIGRPSVKQISHWVASLFRHGHSAYGIRDNPVAVNRRRRKKTEFASPRARPNQPATGKGQQPTQVAASDPVTKRSHELGIPASIVRNSARAPSEQKFSRVRRDEQTQPATESVESTFGTETLMKYMTFGLYGSRSGTPSTSDRRRASNVSDPVEKKIKNRTSSHANEHVSNTTSTQSTFPGYFMVGLQGDLDDENDSEDDAPKLDSTTDRGGILEEKTTSSRIMLRTLVVLRIEQGVKRTADDSSAPKMSYHRLRVVVYVKRPFVFTFLFDLHTDSLAIRSFYRSLHHQLGPLQQSLLNSTSPRKVSERLLEASAPKSTGTRPSSQPIYDLVYDPYNLTVHTTIPNIPEPGSTTGSPAGGKPPWTRVEALSVHSQILNTYTSTRQRPSEFERTCKTNRGWWVVWMRLPHVAASQRMNQMVYRDAFLIRKASDCDAARSNSRTSSTSNYTGSGGSWGRKTGASSGWAPAGLAEGIGIDARQYIEGLRPLRAFRLSRPFGPWRLLSSVFLAPAGAPGLDAGPRVTSMRVQPHRTFQVS